MSIETEARYIGIEEEVTQQILLAERCLGKIKRYDLERLKAVLHQRGHLAYLFIPMCERFMATLENKEARGVVRGIVLEELEGDGHRREFIEEMHVLHDEPHVTWSIFPSLRTAFAMIRIWWKVLDISRQSDLARLVFLRYMGEMSTGVEFTTLYFRLEEIGALDEQRSRFLFPHVRYDMVCEDDHQSHAERYLKLILERIESEEDWLTVREVIVAAARLRERFYAQF